MHDHIREILNDPKFNSPESNESQSEAIFQLITPESWPEINEILLTILKDNSARANWESIVAVFFYSIGRKYPVNADYLIALLYDRITATSENQPGIHDGNLVWSITRELKGVKYDSDYDPFQDPKVWK